MGREVKTSNGRFRFTIVGIAAGGRLGLRRWPLAYTIVIFWPCASANNHALFSSTDDRERAVYLDTAPSQSQQAETYYASASHHKHRKDQKRRGQIKTREFSFCIVDMVFLSLASLSLRTSPVETCSPEIRCTELDPAPLVVLVNRPL